MRRSRGQTTDAQEQFNSLTLNTPWTKCGTEGKAEQGAVRRKCLHDGRVEDRWKTDVQQQFNSLDLSRTLEVGRISLRVNHPR